MNRLPAEASDFTTNSLTVRALQRFGLNLSPLDVDLRIEAVKRWIVVATAQDAEDVAFRLRLAGLHNLSSRELHVMSTDALEQQYSDGGWSQLPDRPTDAYATGLLLSTLAEAGPQ